MCFSLVKIRVLEYDASGFKSPEQRRHIDYTVVKMTVHPDYNDRRFSNNLAVLLVDRAIDLLAHDEVNAACLPTCDDMFSFVFANQTGTRCWTAGWGKDRLNGDFRTVMHKVDLPLVPARRCEQALKREIRKKYPERADRLRLDSSEICAGGEQGKDACDGDGGAPLVCQALSGRWFVVGLVTWGVDCAVTDVPGVYARVSHFIDWIDRQN